MPLTSTTNGWEVAGAVTNVTVTPAQPAATNRTVFTTQRVTYLMGQPLPGGGLSLMIGYEWLDAGGGVIKRGRVTYEGTNLDALCTASGVSVGALRWLAVNGAVKGAQ